MGKRKKILKSDFALKTPINEKNVGIAPRKRRRCKPEDTAKTFLLKNEDQPGFEDRYINDFIGRGVFALRFISKGDFLLEYAGKLIEGKAAEIVPDTNYTFHFVFKGRKACVDATEEPTEGALLGRLVNHAKRGIANSTMRLIDLDGTPRLCLFSLRDIAQGEELRYDYGIDKLPWENQFAEQESSETIHSIPEDENDDMAIGRKESSETIHSVPEDENDDMAIGRNQESSETIHPVPEDRNDDMTIGRNESSETIHSVPEDENDDIAIGRNQQLSETMHSVPEDGNGDMAIGRNQQSSETIHSVPEDRNDDMAIGRNQESSETIHSVTEDENDDIAIGRNQQLSETMHSLPEDGNGDLAIGRNISTSDDISVNVDDDPIDSISESDVILESEDEGMENVTCDIIPIAPITHYPTNFYGSIVVISATGEDGAAFPLTASTCLIGRSKNCDIIINREMIAPEHCKLSVKNNRQVYLDNLCTTHSVQIDKKNVRGSTRLYHDDVISVGDRSFRFQYPVSSSKNMEKRRCTPQNDIEHSENDFSMSEDDSDADPDYKVPEISSESDDEDEDETARSEIIPIYSNKTHQIMQRPIEEDNVEPTLITDPVDGQIVINETTAYKDGRRVVDKQHNCLFCNKLQLRIGRHLQTVHKNEPQVQQILGTSMKKEKEKKLDKLRLEGDYKHNINVLKSNTGFLILARRPSSNSCKQKNYLHTDFLPCEFCLGFFLKTELWRHRSNCLFAPTETKKHTRVQRNSVLLLESSVSDPDLHKGFRDNVVSTLIVDDISLIIRNDRVILKVGENLYIKHGKKQKPYISQEIRLLGRLVMEMRATVGNPNGYLKDFLKPAFFDSTIEACQNLSGIEQTNDACKFRTPSVALKCGPILKKCCVVLKGQALRNSDDIGEKDAERFMKLIEEEWKHKITAVALRSAKETKRNQQVLLPTTADLVKLKDYLDAELHDATKVLKNCVNMENFQKLSSVILCRVMMLNRRRSGETSKILLQDFEKRPNWQLGHNTEIINSMPLTEQQLVKRLDMIEIRGKRGRNVSLIMTPDIKESIQVLNQKRHQVGISETNGYLFPRGNGDGHIEGHVAMRSFASKAELEYPERVGSTNMRKYIATVTQMMNLNDGELEWLSNHLGHSINVHREYYRNQESAIELGKVAKMLLAVDAGNALADVRKRDVDVAIDESGSEQELEDDGIGEIAVEVAMEGGQDVGEPDARFDKTQIDQPRKKKASKTSTKIAWTTEETEAIQKLFKKNYNLRQVPNKKECDLAKQKEPALYRRDWKSIKYKVYNDIQRLKKT